MLGEDVRALAKGTNFAAVTTLRADGSAATQVVWIDCDDEQLLVNTEKHRRKYVNARRDARVTVTMWDAQNPYDYLEVRGEVVEFVDGPTARAHIDELSVKYLGHPYQTTIQSERVILKVRPLATSSG
jgi:PPOX class probable F420-dependent enzyme